MCSTHSIRSTQSQRPVILELEVGTFKNVLVRVIKNNQGSYVIVGSNDDDYYYISQKYKIHELAVLNARWLIATQHVPLTYVNMFAELKTKDVVIHIPKDVRHYLHDMEGK